MHHVLVIGAGKIGSLIAFLLTQSNRYQVYLADIADTPAHLYDMDQCSNFKYVTLDAKDADAISAFIQKHPVDAIVSSLPFYCNIHNNKLTVNKSDNSYSTVTDFAKFLGWSTLHPLILAM